MKITKCTNYQGHAEHPYQSPWSKRKKKIILPRLKFTKSKDSWTNYTTYHIWVHHRNGSAFLRVVV